MFGEQNGHLVLDACCYVLLMVHNGTKWCPLGLMLAILHIIFAHLVSYLLTLWRKMLDILCVVICIWPSDIGYGKLEGFVEWAGR